MLTSVENIERYLPISSLACSLKKNDPVVISMDKVHILERISINLAQNSKYPD